MAKVEVTLTRYLLLTQRLHSTCIHKANILLTCLFAGIPLTPSYVLNEATINCLSLERDDAAWPTGSYVVIRVR